MSTKLHLAVDGKGRPLAVLVTTGQRHESTQLRALSDGICVPRPGGVGRPRKRPDWLVADRGYSYPTCRRLGRRRGIAHTIPTRSTSGVDLGGRSGSTPTATDSATSWSDA